MKRSTFLLAAALGGVMLQAMIPQGGLAATKIQGGQIRKVYAATSSDTVVVDSAQFAAVPGAKQVINVPSGGGTIIATFTAECALFGTSSELSSEVQIRDDNVAIPPTLPHDGSALVFCTGFYGSHSVQVAKRLNAGSHTIKVMARIVEGAEEDDVAAHIDDWTFTILQAD